MKKLTLCMLLSAAFPGLVAAHTPLFSCYDMGDGTILCEGGFSDGSSASGVEIIVTDSAGHAVLQSEINSDGEIEFSKPQGEYQVSFNAGPGHSIQIDGKDIVE